MKHKFLTFSAITFGIGFVVAPLCALLHLPTQVSQFLVGLNWLSGGWCFFVIAQLKGEF
jgi:hypothetical protein